MRHPKPFLIGFICGIVALLLAAFLVLASGVFGFGASDQAGALEKTLAPWALDCSLSRRVPQKPNPFAHDASAWAAGLSHYREDCLVCHGAPDISAREFSMGLNPPAPALEGKG